MSSSNFSNLGFFNLLGVRADIFFVMSFLELFPEVSNSKQLLNLVLFCTGMMIEIKFFEYFHQPA